MKLHKIKVLVGDTVEIILDEYRGKFTNRITRRV
jgi:translation initiation factor IF-1